MFTDGKLRKTFRLEDINSLISFEKWIRDNTKLYKEDQVIDSDHFRIFIEYLKNEMNKVRLLDKKEWLSQFGVLLERLEKDDEDQ
jgi:hypothetical protein